MARLVRERADIIPILGEVFRDHGLAGASLALIEQRTGLGKGSLYHFFPGGKAEMAAAVLGEIDDWFARHIFAPLTEATDAAAGVRTMIAATDGYFQSGRRICLVGALSLNDARDAFATRIAGYFAAWRTALAGALNRAGLAPPLALVRAEAGLAAIQGALVLARALDDAEVFTRILSGLADQMLAPASAASPD